MEECTRRKWTSYEQDGGGGVEGEGMEGMDGKEGCLEMREYTECGDLDECHFGFAGDRVTV